MWWAVITLCTVGYGDLVPLSPFGKLFGSMCCVAGVVMVALPISVISSTFQDQYQEHIENEKILEGKRRVAKEREALLNKMKQRNTMGKIDSESIFSLLFSGKRITRRAHTQAPVTCVCVCARARARARACVCVCVCVHMRRPGGAKRESPVRLPMCQKRPITQQKRPITRQKRPIVWVLPMRAHCRASTGN
eukprot:Tamp_24913.p1 GENE.Tamp_24913~~Tamp_24913.p1  ORF type:complete len:192 (-),score=27.16 Tamp_24913:178-753(-)